MLKVPKLSVLPAKRIRPRSAGAKDVARPLDMGGLENVIGYAIRRAQVAIFQDTAAMLSDLDMTPVQLSVLWLVHRNQGINQISLATALGAESPRMVLIIDELERRGLVARLASTVDRRAHAIFLTREGRLLQARLSKRVQIQDRRLAKQLRGDDPKLLLRMLHNLAIPL